MKKFGEWVREYASLAEIQGPPLQVDNLLLVETQTSQCRLWEIEAVLRASIVSYFQSTKNILSLAVMKSLNDHRVKMEAGKLSSALALDKKRNRQVRPDPRSSNVIREVSTEDSNLHNEKWELT